LPAVPRLLALPIACLALVAAGCGSSSPKSGSEASATATATASPAETPAATDTPVATPTPASTDLTNGCKKVAKPGPKKEPKLKKPTTKLAASKTYVATVVTSCGTFKFTLDAKRAPITGGSFKYLADKKFFDGLTFHRIVPNFVIQGGDPAGTGNGGPGYSVVEAPPSDLKYTKGVVAMAKTQDEAPGTSGSQFFVVTGEGAAQLTPDYALVGQVSAGESVVDKIGSIQADANGTPATPVVIESLKVSVK
jgi:peptidyl-prolyl cis-trans isomerase B (cyclophilin B)